MLLDQFSVGSREKYKVRARVDCSQPCALNLDGDRRTRVIVIVRVCIDSLLIIIYYKLSRAKELDEESKLNFIIDNLVAIDQTSKLIKFN